MLTNKTILITGGTGSLGNKLTEYILSGKNGNAKKVIIFSRDENKQYHMSGKFNNRKLKFVLGDVRDEKSLCDSIKKSDIIIHAAALKHVPICEYNPLEAIKTNLLGTQNIINVVKQFGDRKLICNISTDKACKPINTYGMAKALQERLIINANLICGGSKFINVRYGNVMGSRGSVIPLFQKLLLENKKVKITHKDMTRFLMSLDLSVELIMDALRVGSFGETFIPIVPATRISDLAEVMIEHKGKNYISECIGIRPGEKLHEILISDDELTRLYKLSKYYVIQPNLPELVSYNPDKVDLLNEYSSKDDLLTKDQLKELLTSEGWLDF